MYGSTAVGLHWHLAKMTAATGVELIAYGECRLTSRPQSSAWQALDGTPRRSLAVDWAPTKVSSFYDYQV
jgi:hypothetical protein